MTCSRGLKTRGRDSQISPDHWVSSNISLKEHIIVTTNIYSFNVITSGWSVTCRTCLFIPQCNWKQNFGNVNNRYHISPYFTSFEIHNTGAVLWGLVYSKENCLYRYYFCVTVKQKLREDGECEIATTSLRVSLLCPLGKMRMLLPCRAETCHHLQCFDASLFLQMNERKPTWTCPVCDKAALYDTLVIDGLVILTENDMTPMPSIKMIFLDLSAALHTVVPTLNR